MLLGLVKELMLQFSIPMDGCYLLLVSKNWTSDMHKKHVMFSEVIFTFCFS